MIIVVLAIYNEEHGLPAFLANLRSELKDKEYKIIAVDDGSRDRTAEILETVAGDDLLVIHHRINLNVGAVFAAGLNKAMRISESDDDIVFIMESDSTSSVDVMAPMIEEVERGSEVVIASRYADGGQYQGFPLMRLIYSKGANNLMRWIFGIEGVTDYTIFFRAYRASVLRRAIAFFGPYGFIQRRGFVSNSEILLKLSYFTRQIGEIPFVYDYGKKAGKSKLKVLFTIFEYFNLVLYMKEIDRKIKQMDLFRGSLARREPAGPSALESLHG